MHRQRMKRALVLIAMLALGWAPFAQAQRQEVKEPATSGEPAKAKEKTLPATKQMDEASSVEKTGVPERDGASSGKPTHPPTKQMDKAASPDKTK